MRRQSAFQAVLILIAAVAGVAAGVGYLVKQEPVYYAAAGVDDADDPRVADAVLTKYGDLKNDIRLKPEWGVEFTAAELNALLRDKATDGGILGGFLPPGVSGPRVAVEGDRLKLAARYGDGFWSSVVSVELRAWLVSTEVNTVAVELAGMWLGGLPFGTQWLLDWVTEAAHERNIDVTWYRHNGHPVGLFRFYADQPYPVVQIRTVKIADGGVSVAGRLTPEAGQLQPAKP
jgi:hypothetical protein